MTFEGRERSTRTDAKEAVMNVNTALFGSGSDTSKN